LLSLLFALSSSQFALASTSIRQLSRDPYTNSTSQHRTQVEPDTYSFGSTIVAAFQSGRVFDGGASNIGWATSNDGGKTWTHGFLPGTTVFATPPGPSKYQRASDPSVAYDAKHKVWIISYLAFFNGFSAAVDVLVSRSSDGGRTWGLPVAVNTSGDFNDKNWTVCDDTASSPFFGHCYTEFDDFTQLNLVQMSTSTDGGLTWGSAKTTADHASVIGGQPLVQPNGTVIVPITVFKANFSIAVAGAFRSTDGGASWSSTVTISPFFIFFEDASMRDGAGLVSAEIDGSGKVYVVWQDCRFEPNCATNYGSANDIVLSTSTDGLSWTAVQRIPIDPVGSRINHIIPGISVDKHTSGSHAHLALAFYYFTNAACFTFNCQLEVGFVSSTNGGASWSVKQQLAGPMMMPWMADTTGGFMVGDYISTSIVGNDAFPVFAVAFLPSDAQHLNEVMYTVVDQDLQITGGPLTSQGDALTASGTPHAAKAFPRTTR
jgi:hypothetical protein